MIDRKALAFLLFVFAVSFILSTLFLLAFEDNVTAKDVLNRTAFIMAGIAVYFSYGVRR